MNKSKLENGEVIEAFRKRFKGKLIFEEQVELDEDEFDDLEGIEAFITNALNQQRREIIEEILDYRQEDGKHLIARNSPFGEFLTNLEK